MANEPEKVRTGFYIEKEVLDRCDELLTLANVKSRNEFVTEALNFYSGYLTTQKVENYLLQTLSSVLTSTVRDTENRIARMDFKLAVEISKLAHVIAYSHDIDEQTLQSLHLKCVEEVKRINGAVDFEDAYNYQKRRT
jgi:metal-responsive CopG/Arc/MetJ family transcriptional regulator